jgi:DNA processing protein
LVSDDRRAAAGTLVLLAAAILAVPARRLRALALGDDVALRDWIANESALRLAEARRDARLLAGRLERAGARLIALSARDYPAGLRDLRDPPPFLIVRGVVSPAARASGTAIVGTRNPAAEAARAAYELAGRAAAPIVSGLARGIDAAAHAGALASGCVTIAYVGHGLGATYPPEHTELEERIIDAGGAVLSERLPGESASRWSLLRRDRLQAAHAQRIVLVQSEVDGGAMHAMRFAAQLGRPRFALDPRPDSGFDGNRAAIAGGALPLGWSDCDSTLARET